MNPYPADIRPLTSLRFFAVLAVIAHHVKYFAPEYLWRGNGLVEKGYLAVDFFLSSAALFLCMSMVA